MHLIYTLHTRLFFLELIGLQVLDCIYKKHFIWSLDMGYTMGYFTAKLKRSGLYIGMIRNSKSFCGYINIFNESKKFITTNILLLCLTIFWESCLWKNILKMKCIPYFEYNLHSGEKEISALNNKSSTNSSLNSKFYIPAGFVLKIEKEWVNPCPPITLITDN